MRFQNELVKSSPRNVYGAKTKQKKYESWGVPILEYNKS